MIATVANVLRIYVNSDDRWQGKLLYEAIVELARAMRLAGASVFNVDVSYGANQRLREATSEYRFVGIPVVIEIVDGPGQIDRFLVEVSPMIREGLCAVTPARVVRFVHPGEPGGEGG